nr:hypothetical protein [uncultured Chryseobacterium sp.]
MERILRDEIKLCTSQIQLKDGKIFWLAVFEFEKEKHPIVAKANNVRINIGSKEFLYRMLAIQASQKRIQSVITWAHYGNGAKRKQKARYRTENQESKYVSHQLHFYSKKLIDFCIQQQTGNLILKNQKDKIGIAKEQEFVLNNWSITTCRQK